MSAGDPKSYTGAGLTKVTGIIDSSGTSTSVTLDPSTLGMSYSIPSGSWTTSATGTSYTISGAGNNYYNATSNVSANGIQLDKTADIKIGDKSLVDTLTKIEDRLAILTPDLKKLEKFAALKKAYEHYKLMEKLCQEDEENK